MTVSKVRTWSQKDIMVSFVFEESGLVWRGGPRKGKKAGWTDQDGYTLVRYRGILVREHNLVWLLFHGFWPPMEVDHIDNNPANNHPLNLRLADRHENLANQKTQTRRQGKFKGVYKNASSYYAKIKNYGKQIYIGSYRTELEAAKAYNDKAKELFGPYAKLNTLPEESVE